jgi:hypothetical protein
MTPGEADSIGSSLASFLRVSLGLAPGCEPVMAPSGPIQAMPYPWRT